MTALMTIIAANGEDQNSGLTSQNGTKRETRQFCREVAPGVKMTIIQGVHKYLAVSRYSSRGWTMQEQVLSRRCLLFVDNLVYFYCRSGYFSEDTIWDQHLTELCPRELTEPNVATDFLLTENKDPVSDYHSQLIRYTGRDLTKPEIDTVYAFLGILTRLAATANSDLLCGMLTSAFDNKQGGARRQPAFPSWSWAGWSGVTLLVVSEEGPDQLHSLSTNSEDIYYVCGSSSSTSTLTHGGTGIARNPVRRVWGSNDQARLGSDHSSDGLDRLNVPKQDDTSPPGSEQVNWNAIPRDYELLYFHALTIKSFHMRLSKLGNVLLWPRTSDAVCEQDDPSHPLLASLAAGNFVPSDAQLFSEELSSEQEFDIVLLSKAERNDSFHLSWLDVGNANPWDKAEAGLDMKLDRPNIWALLVVRERIHFSGKDMEEKAQGFHERRALSFIYQDRLGDFEGVTKEEVVLA
ncbi:heterokaryon incompatibility protein [Rutstroemia sp. NJR-2017a BVV2]|nr:heterokaryon incompatibility protein [Rutstroemia sp. NJR-2017a BVV2]